jgi:hypothetical protein
MEIRLSSGGRRLIPQSMIEAPDRFVKAPGFFGIGKTSPPRW